MNKTSFFTATLIFLAIGMLVWVGISEDSTLENKIRRYKEAQELCGDYNVEPIQKRKDGSWEDSGKYTCYSFEEAITPDEDRKDLDRQVNLYCEWKEDRILPADFRNWLRM